LARLFISYKREEQAYAFALRQWLMDVQGWSSEDIFVDVGHLTAGVEWEKKVLAEAEAAEAMLFLASEASLDPESFCYRELNRARGQVLAVTIKGVSFEDKRLLRAVPDRDRRRQIAALDAQPTQPFPFVFEGRNGSAPLNAAQVESIGATLRDLGIAPDSFAWTPTTDDPYPYPGLKPLMEGKEAVFCGRDIEIRDGLKALEELRASVTRRALVIQAPSGAGKSSFLRAGLWQRLRRHAGFTPLAIVRPAKGAVRNEEWGLVTGLFDTLDRSRRLGTRLSLARGEIEERLAADPWRLLADLADADASLDGRRRTLLIGIDQAEEMTQLAPEDDAELDGLLEAVPNAPADLDIRLVLTARDDSVDATLARLAKAGLPQDHVDTWRLNRLPPTRFAEIIVGPAKAAQRAGRPLALAPALVDALVAAAGSGETGATPCPSWHSRSSAWSRTTAHPTAASR
jgi:hypothetical protein